MSEPAGLVIAWTGRGNRASELAAVLDADSLMIGSAVPQRRASAPLRWLRAANESLRALEAGRPAFVVVQSPPVVLLVLAFAWSLVRSSSLVIDLHPAAVRRSGMPTRASITRFIARRADLVLVTDPLTEDRLRRRRVPAMSFFEALPIPSATPGQPPRSMVVTVNTGADDDPGLNVVRSIAESSGAEVVVAGGATVGCDGPVRHLGWIPHDELMAIFDRAAIVLCLTTDPCSVPRAAFEAACHGAVPVLTAGPGAGAAYAEAPSVRLGVEPVATMLREVLGWQQAERDELVSSLLGGMRDRQQRQVSSLRAAVGLRSQPLPART